MGVLYFLEDLRVPFLNDIMLAITYLGDEIAFLVTALILFWCVDKRQGYYILSVGFLGTIANQFLKLWCRVPRPWVLDSQFTAVPEAVPAAGGYSFPSGHSQTAVGTFGGMAYTTRHKLLRGIFIAIAVLVPFSRMYLGVHTPKDVLVGSAMALLLVFLLRPVVMGKKGKYFPLFLGVMLLIAIGYTAFVTSYPFPDPLDSNVAHGIENAYTLLGCLVGIIIVYIVDTKWLDFQTKAVWWAQLLKVLGGLALVLAVKVGAKDLLNGLFGVYAGRAARYGLMVLLAGILWPLSFRFFGKLGRKEGEAGK